MGNVATDFLEAGFYFSFGCSFYYIVFYTVLAPWWRNAVGRGMVSFSFATMLLLLPTILHLIFGLSVANTFFGWYYTSSLFMAGFIELYRTRTVYHIQQRDTPHHYDSEGMEDTCPSESSTTQ